MRATQDQNKAFALIVVNNQTSCLLLLPLGHRQGPGQRRVASLRQLPESQD